MQLTKDNCLAWLRDLVVGTNAGKGNGSAPADGGFNQDFQVGLGGMVLGSTSVYTLDGNGQPMISTAVSSTNGSTNLFGTFTFQVPRDYDQNSDHFMVRVVANMSGGTDAPTITATSSTLLPAGTLAADGQTLNKTATLTAGSTVGGSTVTAFGTLSNTLSSTQAVYEFPMDGLKLVRDELVTIALTTGTHETDDTELRYVEIVYASCLVGFAEAVNTGGKAIGYDAFRNEIR